VLLSARKTREKSFDFLPPDIHRLPSPQVISTSIKEIDSVMKYKFPTSLSVAALLAFFVLTGQSFKANAQDATQRVQITAKRFDFTPGDITLKKGVPVVLVLTSDDVPHGLKFKDLNVVVVAKKGQTSEVAFTPDKVGTFVGQCSVFCGSGHGSMKMTLHVTE
jgi:cytochrome c oxidase subunit 2